MDAVGRPCLKCQPSSRTGENPSYGMIGGRWKRRHHSKPATRHCPTRLRGGGQRMIVPTATEVPSHIFLGSFCLESGIIPPGRLDRILLKTSISLQFSGCRDLHDSFASDKVGGLSPHLSAGISFNTSLILANENQARDRRTGIVHRGGVCVLSG